MYPVLSKLLILALLILGSPVTQAAGHALIIGIEQYPIKPLNGSLEDAKNARLLAERVWGFKDNEIRMLLDNHATRKNILESFDEWLVKGTEPGDDVLFYYSGHGFNQNDNDGDEADGMDETIAPYDVTVTDAGYGGMISDDDFSELVKGLSGRNVRMIFDSCHSGTITRALGSSGDTSPLTKTLPKVHGNRDISVTKSSVDSHRSEESFITGGDEIEVWTAVSAYQLAFTDVIKGSGSVFTNRMLEGLIHNKADKNTDGDVSRMELLEYLRAESDQYCGKIDNCVAGLTPTLDVRKDLLPVSVASMQMTPQKTEELFAAALPRGNTSGVNLSIKKGNILKLGQPLNISVTSPVAGKLILLDIDTKGRLTQIFPNRFSGQSGKGDWIQANDTITIPGKDLVFDLIAREPLGKGTLVAIVTEDEVDISGVVGQTKDLQVIEDVPTYVNSIAARLQKTWHGDDTNRSIIWSQARLEYQIIQ